MELVPTSAYGVRLYQNSSSLVMHYDRVCYDIDICIHSDGNPIVLALQVETHVISSIVHLVHDEDSEPWPIDIEDHNGVLHSVALQPSQVFVS
jgi:hypothetical protein